MAQAVDLLWHLSRVVLLQDAESNACLRRWDEHFELLVHHPEHQKLTAVLLDANTLSKDEPIGQVWPRCLSAALLHCAGAPSAAHLLPCCQSRSLPCHGQAGL